MRIVVSGNLLRFSNFQKEIEIAAPTLERGLEQLVGRFPLLEPVLLDGGGRVRAVHRLFLNGDLLSRDELGREAGADDELTILTAIAGG
jgi:hypothetical protein